MGDVYHHRVVIQHRPNLACLLYTSLYTLCLPGAAAALLFPEWSAYPQWNFMNLNSFLVHGLLILFPILQLVEHTIRQMCIRDRPGVQH